MESVGRYCAAVYRLSQSIFNNKLKDLEISGGQYDFFLVIARNEGISQKEICEKLNVEKSTTAKAVKNLLSKGYVCKKQIENDRRYSSLYLTEKGRESAKEVEAVFSEILDIFSKDIADGEIGQTIAVLKKVMSNLQEEKNKYANE